MKTAFIIILLACFFYLGECKGGRKKKKPDKKDKKKEDEEEKRKKDKNAVKIDEEIKLITLYLKRSCTYLSEEKVYFNMRQICLIPLFKGRCENVKSEQCQRVCNHPMVSKAPFEPITEKADSIRRIETSVKKADSIRYRMCKLVKKERNNKYKIALCSQKIMNSIVVKNLCEKECTGKSKKKKCAEEKELDGKDYIDSDIKNFNRMFSKFCKRIDDEKALFNKKQLCLKRLFTGRCENVQGVLCEKVCGSKEIVEAEFEPIDSDYDRTLDKIIKLAKEQRRRLCVKIGKLKDYEKGK